MQAEADLPRLAHRLSGPTGVDELGVETAEDHAGPWQPNWPAGTERRVLYRDPESGGSLTLLRFPAGYDRLDEAAIAEAGGGQRFEYHSCHEEIVCLEGDYTFGEPELYDFGATTYLNHPPNWLHPARQRSNEGVLLLVRNSHPVDFGFCPIADDWDGVESYFDAPGVAHSPSRAVTRLDLAELPMSAVFEDGSEREGMRGALLWTDEVLGWETWLIEAEAGVTLAHPEPDGVVGPVGDEWFVLEGSLRFRTSSTSTAAQDEPISRDLARHGHFCDPYAYPAGGTEVVAAEPVRALRWVVSGRISSTR